MPDKRSVPSLARRNVGFKIGERTGPRDLQIHRRGPGRSSKLPPSRQPPHARPDQPTGPQYRWHSWLSASPVRRGRHQRAGSTDQPNRCPLPATAPPRCCPRPAGPEPWGQAEPKERRSCRSAPKPAGPAGQSRQPRGPRTSAATGRRSRMISAAESSVTCTCPVSRAERDQSRTMSFRSATHPDHRRLSAAWPWPATTRRPQSRAT